MKQNGLLVAAFGGTLAVLLIAYLVVQQLGATGAAADASPSPSAPTATAASPTTAPVPSASSAGTTAPSPSNAPATASPTKTAAPESPTATPRSTPAKSAVPGGKTDVVVTGSQYADSDVPVNGKITRLPNGGVVLKTDRTNSEELVLTYRLPPASVPSNGGRVDTALCGTATGDFYENYGPPGSEPDEHEYTQPDADGCWHYVGGSISDTSVLVKMRGATTVQIDKVVYTVWPR